MEHEPVPQPDPEELDDRFGEAASDYACARADAARKLGNPQAAEWESTAELLQVGSSEREGD